MSTTVLDVSVGSRLWYQGTTWTVVELDGSAVTLRSADQFKRVRAPALTGIAESLDNDRDDEDSVESLDAVVITSLAPKQRRQIESEARIYEQVVIAANDESFQERCKTAGEQLGISARSVRHRVERFTRHGLSSLGDARLLKPKRRSIAPEWGQGCIEVLDSFTRLSNPTMGMVISPSLESADLTNLHLIAPNGGSGRRLWQTRCGIDRSETRTIPTAHSSRSRSNPAAALGIKQIGGSRLSEAVVELTSVDRHRSAPSSDLKTEH